MTQPIKLLAIDLDGTVVGPNLEVSPRVIDTLRRAREEQGVRVMIATGRTYHSALPFAEKLGITEPLVAYQGALLRELPPDSQTLRHTPIPLDLATEVLQMLQDNHFHVNLYVNDQLFVEENNPYAKDYGRLAGFAPTLVPHLMDKLTAPPSKMMAIDNDRMDWLLNTMHDRYDGRLNVCTSRINFCEVIDQEASKWNAVWAMAQRWGIPQEQIMTIGDQQNDLSMLTQAGLGVAMGNAPKEIKRQAHTVTARIEEDGVAKAVDHFILDPKALENLRLLREQVPTSLVAC